VRAAEMSAMLEVTSALRTELEQLLTVPVPKQQ
jgi:hypothetical protein